MGDRPRRFYLDEPLCKIRKILEGPYVKKNYSKCKEFIEICGLAILSEITKKMMVRGLYSYFLCKSHLSAGDFSHQLNWLPL